jgi:hypothetical protein
MRESLSNIRLVQVRVISIVAIGVRGIPGLKSETWGTQDWRYPLKVRVISIVAIGVRGIPGLKSETWGTQATSASAATAPRMRESFSTWVERTSKSVMPNTSESEIGLQPMRDFDLRACKALPNLKRCKAFIPIEFEHD